MQREDLDQDTLDFCARQAAYHKEQADRGDDDYLDPKDRRNREHVLGPRCRVKAGDFVLQNGSRVYVICAARGEGWFYALQQSPFSGNIDVPMEGQYITDRAPAEPFADEALPIFLEPEPEPEPEPRGELPEALPILPNEKPGEEPG